MNSMGVKNVPSLLNKCKMINIRINTDDLDWVEYANNILSFSEQ